MSDESNMYQMLQEFLNTVIADPDYNLPYSDALQKICICLNLAYVEYRINVPSNRIIRHGASRHQILYSLNQPGGKTCSFQYHADFNGTLSISLTAMQDFFPDESMMKIYHAFSNHLFVLISRNNISEVIQHLMQYDIQTDTLNTQHIAELYQRIHSDGSGINYAVLFINLCNFKFINQTGGTACGDAALIRYADKIREFLTDYELIARPGGDNFVLTIKKEHLQEFLTFLEDVPLSALPGAPDKTFHISAHIGIHISSRPEDAFGYRLECASNALTLGRNILSRKVVYYSDELNARLVWGKNVIASFSRATTQHEFVPFYQPKVNMPTGKIIGLEALVRWHHDGQTIFPDRFISILENNLLITELDLQMLQNVCADLHLWLQAGLTPPPVSVNISRKDLFVPDIEGRIIQIIQNAGIDPSLIEIEITEISTESEAQRIIEFFTAIRSHGILVSLDDFGIGYSSLGLINDVPADIVKIDRSFVRSCLQSERSLTLIRTIIGLAGRLNTQVIAEGVETAEQAYLLMKIGCPDAQGYLYDKPVDFATTTQRISAGYYAPVALPKTESLLQN
ncbi:MAG: GGDEF domain-containing phosphodiesterase [Butyrivibrio sp.]|jgi:diguanylate cyclase (GGDEF)-like protein|nr:GGDEF domain-containing phosphodiesterase [Butyrivibrio sp.]